MMKNDKQAGDPAAIKVSHEFFNTIDEFFEYLTSLLHNILKKQTKLIGSINSIKNRHVIHSNFYVIINQLKKLIKLNQNQLYK